MFRTRKRRQRLRCERQVIRQLLNDFSVCKKQSSNPIAGKLVLLSFTLLAVLLLVRVQQTHDVLIGLLRDLSNNGAIIKEREVHQRGELNDHKVAVLLQRRGEELQKSEATPVGGPLLLLALLLVHTLRAGDQRNHKSKIGEEADLSGQKVHDQQKESTHGHNHITHRDVDLRLQLLHLIFR